MLKLLPNILTISRILIIPVVIVLLYIEDKVISHQLAAALFLVAAITDFLDGYFARVWSLQSNFGRFLDPIADKLLIASIILMLLNSHNISVFPALAIICREILVSGLREFLAGLRVSVPVSKLAKVKTAVQMIAIFLLLLGDIGSNLNFIDGLGNIFLWFSAILTIVTGYAYLEAGLKYMAENHE